MKRCACLPLLAAILLGGCTAAHIRHDTVRTLEWLRLKDGAEVAGSARWVLPGDARIRVVETAPAPDEAWLDAAQEGVDAVFPGGPESVKADFRLLVSWPHDSEPTLGFQDRLALRVALLREADGALVEAAALRVTPHWFARQSSSPTLVRGAFRSFAERLSTTH